MKSLDVVVLCKLFVLQTSKMVEWTYAALAKEVCLSVGETFASVKRLIRSHLFDEYTRSVIPSAMIEFLIHGVKYAFPAEIGERQIGVPTAFSAPMFENLIIYSDKDVYVWFSAKGTERGMSIRPLSKTAANAALKDRALYDYLSLIDCLRVGRSREVNIAIEKLNSMIRDPQR